MKYLIALVAICFSASAQDNPYAVFGYEDKTTHVLHNPSVVALVNQDTAANVSRIEIDYLNFVISIYKANNFIPHKKKITAERFLRFLSVDQLTAKFPMLTPYQYASNGPIQNIDIDGLEGAHYYFGFDQKGIPKLDNDLSIYDRHSSQGNSYFVKRFDNSEWFEVPNNVGDKLDWVIDYGLNNRFTKFDIDGNIEVSIGPQVGGRFEIGGIGGGIAGGGNLVLFNASFTDQNFSYQTILNDNIIINPLYAEGNIGPVGGGGEFTIKGDNGGVNSMTFKGGATFANASIFEQSYSIIGSNNSQVESTSNGKVSSLNLSGRIMPIGVGLGIKGELNLKATTPEFENRDVIKSDLKKQMQTVK